MHGVDDGSAGARDISVLMGVIVWGLIGTRYIWPALRTKPRPEALQPLLLLHAFRFVGLAFLVPGVVSPDLPDAFARPAAYGDLATSLLALLGIATLGSRLGTVILWVFNIVAVDLLNAFYQADRVGVGFAPGLQGDAYSFLLCSFPSPRDARHCVPSPAPNRECGDPPCLIRGLSGTLTARHQTISLRSKRRFNRTFTPSVSPSS